MLLRTTSLHSQHGQSDQCGRRQRQWEAISRVKSAPRPHKKESTVYDYKTLKLRWESREAAPASTQPEAAVFNVASRGRARRGFHGGTRGKWGPTGTASVLKDDRSVTIITGHLRPPLGNNNKMMKEHEIHCDEVAATERRTSQTTLNHKMNARNASSIQSYKKFNTFQQVKPLKRQ